MGGSATTIAPRVLDVPQSEPLQDFVIPADGKEPSLIADTSGKIGVEQKIIQLEQKVNQLMYLNAIVFLLIVLAAGSLVLLNEKKLCRSCEAGRCKFFVKERITHSLLYIFRSWGRRATLRA